MWHTCVIELCIKVGWRNNPILWCTVEKTSNSSGRVISSSQRPLPGNTQHSQQTDIYPPGGIRTHDLSRRADVDLHLRPRGQWDRQLRCRWKCEKYDFHILQWGTENKFLSHKNPFLHTRTSTSTFRVRSDCSADKQTTANDRFTRRVGLHTAPLHVQDVPKLVTQNLRRKKTESRKLTVLWYISQNTVYV